MATRTRTFTAQDGELYERVPASSLDAGDTLDAREETARDTGAPA